MSNEKAISLLGELFQLLAKYNQEDFEIAGKIIVNQQANRQVKYLIKRLSEVKKEIDIYPSETIRKKPIDKRMQMKDMSLLDVEDFSLLLKKVTSNKKRFSTTMTVRLFLEQIFGHPIGNIKDSRERIINKSIREFKEAPNKKKMKLYSRLIELTSEVSSEFEGYYNIIRGNKNAFTSQSNYKR